MLAVTKIRDMDPEQKSIFYGVNKYVQLTHEDYKDWAFEIDSAPVNKGQWRQCLGLATNAPLDLEIGTGNGYFFEHRNRSYPQRGLLGIELKYKPMIQTVKRSLFTGKRSFRLLRYNAKLIDQLFSPGELNDVFIFFPDPWEKRRVNKHRLIDEKFLSKLFEIQQPNSTVEIKTDSESYYRWIVNRLPETTYQVLATEEDLHNSKWAAHNFQTHFERLWTKKGRRTFYVRLQR